jgi:hypothetical protein
MQEIVQFLKAERIWFETNRSPAEFRKRAMSVDRRLGSEFLFNRNEAHWVTDVLPLSLFAIVVPRIVGVRLSRHGEPADGFVVAEETEIPIQISEVLQPGRERGKEYRQGAPAISHGNASDWQVWDDQIHSAVRLRLEAKRKKSHRYPNTTLLLLYMNIGSGFSSYDRRSLLDSILNWHAGNITRIAVIWGTDIYGPANLVANGHIRFDWRMLEGA